MQIRRRRVGQTEHKLDDRIAGHRPFRDPSVQLDPIGLQHGRLRTAADTVDYRLIKHDRGALRRFRRAAHARLPERPIGDVARSLAGLGNGHRPGELTDQQRRLIDLRDDHEIAGLERDWRLVAPQLDRRINAANLEAERKAADGLPFAVIEAPGIGFTLAPARNPRLGRTSGQKPEAAPTDRQHHHKRKRHEDRPQPTARGGPRLVHRLCSSDPLSAGSAVPAQLEAGECGVSEEESSLPPTLCPYSPVSTNSAFNGYERRIKLKIPKRFQSVRDFGISRGTVRARSLRGGCRWNKESRTRLSKRSRPKINNTPIRSCSLS